MLNSIYEDVLIEPVAIDGAADNETITSAEVDMQGFEGVAFVVTIDGGQAIAWSMKAQQDTVTGMGSAADLEGTAMSFTESATVQIVRVLDIKQPQERFVRVVLTVPNVDTATAVAILAMKYGAAVKPVGNTGELHQAPAEGTA